MSAATKLSYFDDSYLFESTSVVESFEVDKDKENAGIMCVSSTVFYPSGGVSPWVQQSEP